jgi:predicted MPP superfamily phosphohydrolase
VLGWLLVVLAARRFRGRLFATFSGVVLGVHTLIAIGLAPAFAPVLPVVALLQVLTWVYFLALVRPAMRPRWYRFMVSLPASWFVAGTFLALPWALLFAVGFQPVWAWLPYLIAFAGMLDSLIVREEVVDVVLDGAPVDSLRRTARGTQRSARPLRIVQITDPHLGAFMSVERLRWLCERAVGREPDLILLTGDFLTMESQGEARYLAEALAPLRAYQGRVFACRGNHDLEAPRVVADALASAGVQLLIDDAVTVQTELGPVEVLGIDFHFRDRAKRVDDVVQRHPRHAGVLRVALLHDPGAFKHVPDGAADLVLSGHTHGGQVGLLWLGIKSTIVSALTPLPDHGFWGLGKNRLYVHRGTGHYGFPLRVGVPAEYSVLQVHAGI